ncbi:MAG: DUF4392 domain-containing protein [Planctomyces sp.]|nr:DUF4392 domain-containing protein [Planctomyces sp.]
MDSLESLIRRDPGQRGLLAALGDIHPLGHLRGAAESLVERDGPVAIVTGFAIPLPHGPVAETDGPPGAVMLADVLRRLGRSVTLVTDIPCRSAVAAAAEIAGLSDVPVEACPVDGRDGEAWCEAFVRGHRDLAHLVSIERVGPAHTAETADSNAPGTLTRYLESTPEPQRGRCCNMRGEIIDDITAPLHRLFEQFSASPHGPTTIGIGDGGNELGMGRLPWDLLLRHGGSATSPLCRVATDWLIVAGVSNWGGMALAAAMALRGGHPELATVWTEDRQRALLEMLAARGPAVDGATRIAAASVDGLSDSVYFGVWREVQAWLAGSSRRVPG